MEKEFKYNAFISYRHNDLDKYVAESLHRLIETYKMPKPVVEKYNIKDNNIRRVFRDQEELPLASNLADPIMEAISQSKFLIVICSPRLKESIWCKREIENFIKLHGRTNILCVLIEGEPKDSFPDELMYYEEKTLTESGKEEIKKVECEPLAMDVRGSTKKEVYKKLQTELIRIIAPMYNLDYDDIKRRHEERKLKTRIRIFKIISIISIIFAIYSGLLFFKIYLSSEQLKYDQAINLADLSNEILQKDDRKKAIEKAKQSIDMKLTPKGLYQLTESQGVYYTPDSFRPISQLDTSGKVEAIKTDLDKKYLLSYDSSKELVLWDLNDENRIKTISDIETSTNKNKYTFIANKGLAYQNKNKEIIILDLNGNETKKIKLDFVISSINSSESGKYIEISKDDKIFIYETNTYSEIAIYQLPNGMNISNQTYFDEKEENLILVSFEKSAGIHPGEIEILTYNIEQKEVINSTKIEADKATKMLFKNDRLIVLANRKASSNLNTIIINYNYKDGAIYYQKEYEGEAPLDISMKENTLLVSSFGTSYLLDINTGEQKARFSIGNKEVDSYSLENTDFYILFTSNGEAHTINGALNGLNDEDNDVIYKGLYNFNLSNYEKFLYTNKGILAYTNSDNRIIIYGRLENSDMKEIKYGEKGKASFIYEIENGYLVKGDKGGYIFNKDYELIGYVPKLYDYRDGKIILKSDSKYYETKIYGEKELRNLKGW